MAPNVDDFNEDELKAPEWVNKDLFVKALKNWENSEADIVVKNLKLTPGTGKGDHYASIMFRATMEYQYQGEDKTISMIIKIMPEEEGQKKEFLGETHIFETEIGMYTEVIPRFEEILRSVGDQTVLGAKCIYYSLTPKKFVIFEDIVPLGYIVIRNRFPVLEEVKAAYSKLAKWQAISYKLSHEEPQFLQKYQYGFLTMKNFAEGEFVNTGIDDFISLLETLPPTLSQYKPYFESIKSDLVKKCKAAFKEYNENRQEDGLYVLVHGDFHGKNMMFKHNQETGKLEDVMLLDFQLAYMGPMAYDLLYSRFMLMDIDLRADGFEELLKFHFEMFTETLQKIGFDGPLPTWETLQHSLKRHRPLEMWLFTTFLPASLPFFKSQLDPNEVLSNAEVRRKELYMSNEELIKELHVLLPKYASLGYFDLK